ncbi:hypothetical protein HN832_03375 [archaeon]|nr:hypothetical protein [archaeon]MBT4373562.1 hypothetical protein [archaeon]MBT4532010.1 hypothetical protein [archaeon]MBT7001677.1 hypothetical protein [archaeon]MBT7282431.1 hypothetical protein [archaeon]
MVESRITRGAMRKEGADLIVAGSKLYGRRFGQKPDSFEINLGVISTQEFYAPEKIEGEYRN